MLDTSLLLLLLLERSAVKVLRHEVILQPRQELEPLLAVGADEPARHVSRPCRVLRGAIQLSINRSFNGVFCSSV